ncbi:DUF7114 family protein [Halocatena halophila]|uniref:DUF7114 family protein n=1 Tax=Halocatena halophila TaxID=2814576 RepID=UPI002ED50D31
MDEAAAVRSAARATVEDVEPERLRSSLLGFIDSTSLTPGVVALLTARLCSNPDGDHERPAAGVQLIYNGLRLTKELAHTEPWLVDGQRERGNMEILVADVLVARGFSLLSHTSAGTAAVDVVRSFGHNEAKEFEDDHTTPEATERALKRDVLELALITGTSVVDEVQSAGMHTDLHRIATDLVESCDGTGFPAPETFLSNGVADRLTQSVAGASVDS